MQKEEAFYRLFNLIEQAEIDEKEKTQLLGWLRETIVSYQGFVQEDSNGFKKIFGSPKPSSIYRS